MTHDAEMPVLGLVFSSFKMGGLERIVAHLAAMFRDMGFRVVLLSALPPEEDFYPSPEGCTRVCVGGWKTPEDAARRQAAIKEAIEKHGIGVLFMHSYFGMYLSDELAVARAAGVKTVVHVHSSVPGLFVRKGWRIDIASQVCAFRSADSVIAVSRADQLLLRMLGVKARYLPNPVFEVPGGFRPVGRSGRSIVWIGRLVSSVKRPVDALRIFERVHERMPDATLTMLGDGVSAKDVHQFLGERPTLAGSVRLTGAVRDVWPELAKADLMLLTSAMEGFPGCVAEAYAAGVPVVGYALDAVELCRNREAYHAVPQESVEDAAQAAVSLLSDPERLRSASSAARAEFERFKSVDQESAYRELVADVAAGRDGGTAGEMDPRCRDVVATLFSYSCQADRMHKAEVDALKKRLAARPSSVRECVRFVFARLFGSKSK